MIVYGYAKATKYAGDGTLMIQVRIPTVHGPYVQTNYRGQQIHNYTADEDLPWYPSLLLPYLPGDGAVVAVSSLDNTSSNWLVIGITGGKYQSGGNLL